jgi:uncharacterized protein with FMN-binding domain
MKQNSQKFNLSLAAKKFFLSAFVVITFIAYVAHERFSKPDSPLSTNPSVAGLSAPSDLVGTNLSTVPTKSTLSSGSFKDGTYVGSEVDAYYGLVKVQATIQNGKISDVQFLEYPQDRRTSQRINSIAVPDLQQEALQTQTANVDVISGATLTSQAFQVSLQAALDAARN